MSLNVKLHLAYLVYLTTFNYILSDIYNILIVLLSKIYTIKLIVI